MGLAQKLGIKDGMRLWIHGAPEGYSNLLAPLPDGAEFNFEKPEEFAFLQIFIRDFGDLESHLPEMLRDCGENRLLWITYPKVTLRSTHGLSRDIVRDALRKLGWRAVTIVAVDSIWAALRFKHIES